MGILPRFLERDRQRQRQRSEDLVLYGFYRDQLVFFIIVAVTFVHRSHVGQTRFDLLFVILLCSSLFYTYLNATTKLMIFMTCILFFSFDFKIKKKHKKREIYISFAKIYIAIEMLNGFLTLCC